MGAPKEMRGENGRALPCLYSHSTHTLLESHMQNGHQTHSHTHSRKHVDTHRRESNQGICTLRQITLTQTHIHTHTQEYLNIGEK